MNSIEMQNKIKNMYNSICDAADEVYLNDMVDTLLQYYSAAGFNVNSVDDLLALDYEHLDDGNFDSCMAVIDNIVKEKTHHSHYDDVIKF